MTGLMMAVELAQRGLPVRDKEASKKRSPPRRLDRRLTGYVPPKCERVKELHLCAFSISEHRVCSTALPSFAVKNKPKSSPGKKCKRRKMEDSRLQLTS